MEQRGRKRNTGSGTKLKIQQKACRSLISECLKGGVGTVGRGVYGLSAQSEQGETRQSPRVLTEGNQVDIATLGGTVSHDIKL